MLFNVKKAVLKSELYAIVCQAVECLIALVEYTSQSLRMMIAKW